MQSTRVELEQKLRDERRAAAAEARSQEAAVAEDARIKANDAVAAAQREAAAAAEIVLNRDREQSATQENANITAEISDVMTRVHLMKTQLRGLEQAAYDCTLQEECLALELEQMHQKSQDFLEGQQPPSSDASSSATAAAAASSQASPVVALAGLPQDMIPRVNAVLDKASCVVCVIMMVCCCVVVIPPRSCFACAALTLRPVAAADRRPRGGGSQRFTRTAALHQRCRRLEAAGEPSRRHSFCSARAHSAVATVCRMLSDIIARRGCPPTRGL